MTNRADQIGTREWLEENNRRVIFQNHMYKCAGRDNPDHPMHGLFTGLWHDFCINEAERSVLFRAFLWSPFKSLILVI